MYLNRSYIPTTLSTASLSGAEQLPALVRSAASRQSHAEQDLLLVSLDDASGAAYVGSTELTDSVRAELIQPSAAPSSSWLAALHRALGALPKALVEDAMSCTAAMVNAELRLLRGSAGG